MRCKLSKNQYTLFEIRTEDAKEMVAILLILDGLYPE
jgi:hypothetical protein